MNDLKFTFYARGLFLLLLIGVCQQQAQSQEIHFSQFRNAPVQLGPAMTGIFEGDIRFMGNYRSQWRNLVDYQTINASFDKRFFPNDANTSFWGGGLVFNYDWAGDSKLSTAYLGLNISFTHKLVKNHFLSAGVSLGGFQRSFKLNDLTWDDQFDGKKYIPGSNTGENFDNTSVFYGDFGGGLNWHFRQMDSGNSRTNFDVGLGILHINEPKKNFYDNEEVRLPRLFNVYGMATIQLRPKWDVVVLGTGKYQGPETEHVIGGAGKFHVDPNPRGTALQLGMSYRFNADGIGTGDAIIPNFELHHRDWLFGLSYDISISELADAVNGLGGLEVSFIYLLRNVEDESYCPTCPPYL